MRPCACEALRLEVQRLGNDLADALDVPRGKASTALTMAVEDRNLARAEADGLRARLREALETTARRNTLSMSVRWAEVLEAFDAVGPR